MNSIDSPKSVGNGRSIMVWEDLWVPNCPKFHPKPISDDSLGVSMGVDQPFNHKGT
jgi:hypothetical protein